MSTFFQDVRYALRSLGKSPGFTAVAVLTLALGIGFNTAVFSVVDAAVFRPLAYAKPAELVRLIDTNPSRGIDRFSSSPLNFVDWRSQNRTLAAMAAYTRNDLTLLEGSSPERLQGQSVSPALFPLLGVSPMLGHAFDPEDEKPGRDKTAVLSFELWQRRFGGDRAIVGKTISLEGGKRIVAGVMPRAFRFPASKSAELWMPLVLDAETLENRGAHWLSVIARLKPGVTLAQARADLDVIAARLEAAYPEKNKGWGILVTPLSEAVVGRSKKPLLLLLGAVGFVLLIACVNVSNLLVARGVGRRREVAVRTALGAGRARLIRQLLTESLVLALLGGAAGAVLAVWGAEALVALSAGTLPRSAEAGVDARVLLFALAASLATAAVSGLWPALRATTAADGETLREGHGSAGLPRGAARARRALLVVELALTLVLLAGAVLLLRSMAAVLRVDPGFRAAGALTARLELPEARYPERAQQAAFYRDLQGRLAALPGVAAAGTSNFAPLSGSRWTLSTKFLDHPVPAGDEPSLEYRVAGGEFFRAAGIPLKRGRFFTAEDRADAPRVAILTEAAARRHFPGEDPIGRQIVIGDRVKEPRRIVGVVGDVLEGGLTEPAAPELYVPAEQVPWSGMAVIVRTEGDPMRLVPSLRAAIASLDRSLPVEDIGRLSDAVSRSLGERRFALTLLSAFSVLALILAAVGIYGVVSYTAAQRQREVGIRMALGARRADVLRLFVREALTLAGAGILLGLALAAGATRLLSGMLFGVAPTDPASYAAVATLLFAAVLAASLIPAHRATRVSPIEALRNE
jgi:putative ABC transport system permease protein